MLVVRRRIDIYVILTVFLALLFALPMTAQTTKVKGRVTDSASGEGIPFVAIYFYGTTIGVSTDMDGYYSMEPVTLLPTSCARHCWAMKPR